MSQTQGPKYECTGCGRMIGKPGWTFGLPRSTKLAPHLKPPTADGIKVQCSYPFAKLPKSS